MNIIRGIGSLPGARFFLFAVSAILLATTGVTRGVAADKPATVGDLIGARGRQLKKDEILEGVAGATIDGAAMGYPNAKFQMRYAADGTANGKGLSPQGWAPISGTWSANDQDQYCQDLKVQGGNQIRGCFFYFMLGDRLFAAQSADKSASVYERTLTR